MLFNSLEFFIFFPLVVFFYFALPHKFRWAFLLLASYYFYMCWKAEYALLILFSTSVDYFCSLKIGQAKDSRGRKKFLILSLLVNLGVLFAFKYFNFFNDSLRTAFNHFNIFYDVPAFKILLPVGISFYTFQSLSYTIDVYRGQRLPEKHFGMYALYVSFFPQLVAGPIERSTHLLPQFFEKHHFNYVNFIEGSKLIIWGLFKKVVIADRLAMFVNPVYNNPSDFSGWPFIIATYCFAFQIFCDFSGYSDIAVGSARILGFRLMDNFKTPYLAQSINEFWQRWHISLTTWFRDYVYIPLGGNRVGKGRWYFNIVFVFLVSGLWHGANWTFVVWSALHAFYYICSQLTKGIREGVARAVHFESFESVLRVVRVIFIFNIVSFAWIFFRANSLEDAFYIVSSIGRDLGSVNIFSVFSDVQIILLLFCALPAVIRVFFKNKPVYETKYFQQVFYALILNFIIFFGVQSNEAFIYFQF